MPETPKRRRSVTRPLLLEGAARAIAKHGYAGASVEIICAEAGFTRGAFYSNFQSKDELGILLYEHRASSLIDSLRSSVEGSNVVADVMTALTDPTRFILNSDFELAALRDAALAARVRSFNDGIVAELASIVPRLVEQAGHPSIVDPTAAAQAVVALFRGLAAQSLLSSASAPDAKLLVTAVLGAYSSAD